MPITTEQQEILDSLAQGFMKPHIYKTSGWEVDGDSGIAFIPSHVIPEMKLPKQDGETDYTVFEDHYEGRRIYSAEFKSGWVAYLSAPGYMDSTNPALFETEGEAVAYLCKIYGENA